LNKTVHNEEVTARITSLRLSIALSLPLMAPLSAESSAAQPDPFADHMAKAVVLLFTRSDCPISNRYAPEVRRLNERYSSQKIRFFLVYPDRDETPETIAKHRTEYNYPIEAIRDPKHELVVRARVKVTPEAAVFVPSKTSWNLTYHGRIDDRYADFGKSRPEPKERDLEEVLTAILAGKPVPHGEAKARGCYIADLR
jgi:AhpC/TSA family